ncbi:E2/UBC family protein, partial [Piscirickettsia salmonis]
MNETELDSIVKDINLPYVSCTKKINNRLYSLVLSTKNNNWNIELCFPDEFPYCLPKAKLADKKFIGSIAHVNQEGIICVQETDSLLIDYYRPLQIIEAFIQDVTNLLNRVKLKIYQDELKDEFEGYFSSLPKVKSFYYTQNNIEFVYLRVTKSSKANQTAVLDPILLYGKDNALPSKFSDVNELNEIQVIKIIHLPLFKPVLPPVNGQK